MANFHECMTCGRAVDAEKAKLDEKKRFCSTRCLEYFENGWFFDGTNAVLASGSTSLIDPSKSASARSKSGAQKERWRVSRKAALAESWKKYQEKGRSKELPKQ